MQKGFIPTWIAVLIAVIVVGGAVYFGINAYHATQSAITNQSNAGAASSSTNQPRQGQGSTGFTSPFVSLTPSAPTSTPPPKKIYAITVNKKNLDCKSDMTCFASATINCDPATVTWNSSSSFRQFFVMTVTSTLRLRGVSSNGTCGFVDSISQATVAPDAQNATSVAAAALLPRVSAQVKKESGTVIACNFAPEYVAPMIGYWSVFSPNTNDKLAGKCVSG